MCLQPQGGATELHHSSVDAPPHDGHRGQQTNHRARCRGGGGVTQVRVAALEGKTGNLEMIDTVTDQRSGGTTGQHTGGRLKSRLKDLAPRSSK